MHLDLIGAEADLVTHGSQAFGDSIGDAPGAGAEVGTKAGFVQIADEALVAMAAGLGEGRPETSSLGPTK